MKKGKKRLLLGWICLLLSLCMVTAASAETDGTPIQPCHQVTMTEQKSTAQSGASISVWHITTALGTVDAELNALADDYAAELSPLLQKPGRERTQNSALTVRILHSRTGMSWMSFMVQARLEYHRQIQQVRFTTRTYDMLTGQRITLADIFPADSPAWKLLEQAVRDAANAYYPDETPDAAAVEALCENLAQADFMLYGMSLVIPLPSVYENHPQLMQATLYYPQIRAYMTEEAQRQTDNASLYRFCALTYDDGPNQWITPHVLDALMKTGARATFFLVGSRVSDFAYLARQEHDEGHAIATHFYEHLYANQEQGDKFRAMYDKVNRAHIAAIGIAPAYARAPGGQWQRMGSYGVGWPLIQWTAEAQDWSGGDQGPDAQNGWGNQRPELPDGAEAGQAPEPPTGRNGDGTMPEPPAGFDPQNGEWPELPEGMEEGQMPEPPAGADGERPELPEGVEPGQMPDGEQSGDFGFGGPGAGGAGGPMGANASEDCLIQINGGVVTINAGGDAVDSNGYVEVTGGELVGASSGAGDSALDYEYGATVTGGTVILAGGVGMAETFSEGSTQPFALVSLNGSANTELSVESESGEVLARCTVPVSFQCVTLSVPGLAEGATSKLVAGDATTDFTASTTPSGGMGAMGAPGGMEAPRDRGDRGGRDAQASTPEATA